MSERGAPSGFGSASAPATEPAVSTPFPDAPLSLPAIKITPQQRTELGISLKMLIDVNLGNRTVFDQQLDINNAIYEMRKLSADVPWPNAANIVLPLVHAAVDEYVSRINGTIFVPRLLTVRGNDPISAQYAHLSEEYYNGASDQMNWSNPWETAVHLCVRDGTSYTTCFWELSTHEEIRYSDEPVMTPDGQTQPLPDGSGLVTQRTAQRLSFVDYDGPKFRASEARDVVWIPNYAPSKEVADAVAIKLYMPELQFRKYIAAGIFDEETAYTILDYNSSGQGELSYDPQGWQTYTIGGQFNIADVSVAPPAGIPMTRGPVEMWMVFTKQFMFDEKLGFQEVVAWVHDRSRLCPGVVPFEYWRGRPIFPLSIIPRPNRIYGFALPTLLQGIQEEADTQHNQRLNWMDMLLQPIRWRTASARISDEDRVFGPGTEMRVMKKDDFGFYDFADRTQSTVAEEQMLLQYRDMVTGAPQAGSLPSPALTGGSNQRSARAAQTAAAIQGMMTALTLRRVRSWLLENFEYAAALTMQYGTNQIQTVQQTQAGPQKLTIPKEILMLDYTYGIAGQGGPLDKEQRRQDMMLLVQLLTATPLAALLQGNQPRLWTLARALLETFDIPEVTTFIGTMQEAQQQQQMQAQEAQRQQKLAESAELMKQVFSHTKFQQPSAPRQPGQQRGNGAQQQAPQQMLGA